jgi:hypothetical protein
MGTHCNSITNTLKAGSSAWAKSTRSKMATRPHQDSNMDIPSRGNASHARAVMLQYIRHARTATPAALPQEATPAMHVLLPLPAAHPAANVPLAHLGHVLVCCVQHLQHFPVNHI